MAITRLNNNSITSVTTLPSGIPTGKVLQCLQYTHTASFNTSSSSYVYTGVNCPPITLSSTSNKALVMFSVCIHGNSGAYGTLEANFAVYQTIGATTTSVEENMSRFRTSAGGLTDATHIIDRLVSPSTTSEITFKLYMKSLNGNPPYLNPNNSDKMTATVMEIAG